MCVALCLFCMQVKNLWNEKKKNPMNFHCFLSEKMKWDNMMTCHMWYCLKAFIAFRLYSISLSHTVFASMLYAKKWVGAWGCLCTCRFIIKTINFLNIILFVGCADAMVWYSVL